MAGLRRDLMASYLATASRVGAWAVISALVVRDSADSFARLSVMRGTVTLLTYLIAGVGPVLLRRLSHALKGAVFSQPAEQAGGAWLGYAGGRDPELAPAKAVYAAGMMLVFGAGVSAVALIVLATLAVDPGRATVMAPALGLAFMGAGMLCRVVGDVAGSVLQARGRIALDNAVVAVGEWGWPAMYVVWEVAIRPPRSDVVQSAAVAFFLSGLLAALARIVLAGRELPGRMEVGQRIGPIVRSLVMPALVLTLAQLADFCYGPMNQLLIAQVGGARAVANYAPVLQVDAALLLLTGAVSAVLLPRMTAALAEGNVPAVRRMYVRGTLATGAVILMAAVPVALAMRPLLDHWLGQKVPDLTVRVARLVLIHTVMGGTAGIARASLLAAGEVRRYAVMSLSAGCVNVGLAAAVLKLTDWGVPGVVWVTIATVASRCLLWMPWEAWRALGKAQAGKWAGGGASPTIATVALPVGEAD